MAKRNPARLPSYAGVFFVCDKHDEFFVSSMLSSV